MGVQRYANAEMKAHIKPFVFHRGKDDIFKNCSERQGLTHIVLGKGAARGGEERGRAAGLEMCEALTLQGAVSLFFPSGT